jgi:hypothetical protein
MSANAQEFGRKISLVVTNSSGAITDFSQFRCVFNVQRGDTQTPNTCDVRIYNLSDNTINALGQPEGSTISLSAGYAGNFGLIFTGEIIQYRSGREDQLNTYLAITAADGDEAYNYARISYSGPNQAGNILTNISQAFLQYGIQTGYIPDFTARSESPRRVVLSGSLHEVMRDFCATNRCTLSIQDGKLQVVYLTEYIPGNVTIISPTTGLIGVPEQTATGVEFRCLLNPNVKICTAVQIQGAINQYRFQPQSQPAGVGQNYKTSLQNKLNSKGFYYVMVANHSGDTRGNNWYTDVTCLSIDSSVTDETTINNLYAPKTPAPVKLA